MADLHISISAEPIAHLGPLTITNSLLTGLLVTVGIVALALFYGSQKVDQKKMTRFQAFIDFLVEAIYKLTRDIAGETKARIFLPLIGSAIIFILLNNWAGLLPGVGTIGVNGTNEIRFSRGLFNTSVEAAETTELAETDDAGESKAEGHGSKEVFIPIFRAATADLNTTIALALISVGMTQFYGLRFLGASYLTKFFNFKQGPIFTFVGFLELISEFSKIISFAFRLFGNIFAGEVLLAVIAFLVPVIAPMPFLGLEIFVGMVQALVFSMLTLVFINMATDSHHDH